jgi:Flp pilus assembly pilin Flp
MSRFQKLVDDDSGFIVTIELILIATILVIGLIAGLAAVRDAVVSELSDVAGAVQDLNQSYQYTGVQGNSGASAGSAFVDGTDWADTPDDPSGSADNCIQFFGVANEL